LRYTKFTEDESVWPLLIEKAWAKIIGTFDRSEGGHFSVGLMSLAGTYSQSYTLTDKSEDQLNNIYKTLKKSDDNGYMMGLAV